MVIQMIRRAAVIGPPLNIERQGRLEMHDPGWGIHRAAFSIAGFRWSLLIFKCLKGFEDPYACSSLATVLTLVARNISPLNEGNRGQSAMTFLLDMVYVVLF